MGKNSTNQPGIQWIAAEAGVSTATVSRVFNHHPYVSETVKEKVLTAARKLGYAPTISSSRSLFGILALSGNGYSFGAYANQILTSCSRKLFEAGCQVQIFNRTLFPYILSNTFRGVVTFSAADAVFFRTAKIPCVTINDPCEGVFNVAADHCESLRIAVEYLLELGHRKIAFLHASPPGWGTRERLRGWHETLTAAGIPAAEHYEACYMNPAKDISPAVRELLNRKITALIVEGEGNGLIADHAIKELGIRIPDELSLVSFEQTAGSEFMFPAHTTVCQNFDELGNCAAETLIRIALHPADRTRIPGLQMLHNHLIKRASCAPPSR